MTRSNQRQRPVRLAAVWGVVGVCAILGQALWRLTPLALEPIQEGLLNRWQAALYVVWAIWMGIAEGYRGFQKQFSPRVIQRARHLAWNPRPLHVVFAPFFCMGLFHATRRRLIISWGLLVAIVILVVAVRQLPQPYRGIVDGGVVLGLSWGVLAIFWFAGRALVGKPVPGTAEVPEEAAGDRAC